MTMLRYNPSIWGLEISDSIERDFGKRSVMRVGIPKSVPTPLQVILSTVAASNSSQAAKEKLVEQLKTSFNKALSK